MGYMHIDNLYKNTEILMFKECYALEKIHGTSAHITWSNEKVSFFSGGTKHSNFILLFDEEALAAKFKELFDDGVIIYGEAYGGKEQGMSATYGQELKFIVFDVKVGDSWLSVPQAEEVATKLGLEFVDYVKIAAEINAVDEQRDKPSTQAKRNGIEEDKIREGVVLRPLIEATKNNGARIIVKHKRAEFGETKTPREIDPAKLKILEAAVAIADEWVTPMRLAHVLDKLNNPTDMTRTREVIAAMVEDVRREAKGEIEESPAAFSAIAKRTAQLFKTKLNKLLHEVSADD